MDENGKDMDTLMSRQFFKLQPKWSADSINISLSAKGQVKLLAFRTNLPRTQTNLEQLPSH